MPSVNMSVEEYLRLIEAVNATAGAVATVRSEASEVLGDAKAVKRKVSAYNRKYKAAFKKVSSRFKLKSGKWKKNGFRMAVKAAHKMAGGKK